MNKQHSFGGDAKPLRRVRAFPRLPWRSKPPETQPSPEWLAHLDASQAIAPSPLVGVVAVGRTVVAADVTVDLIAIEIRDRGAVVSWRARCAREYMLMSADVQIVDDRGTAYNVIQGGASGRSHTWEGQALLMPPPPIGAQVTVSIESFGPHLHLPWPPHLPTEVVRGPWSFVVDIDLK